MKNMKWLSRVFIMALGALAFIACSDDDDNVKLSFPEKQPVDCSVGETATLKFDAEDSWTLASSRLWCKFKDGNEIVSSLSGGPGEQTVTITVTEDVWGFEDAVAEIIMGMQNQTQIIATVNRAAKSYQIKAYDWMDKEYNQSNPAVISYNSNVDISLTANFDWQLKECPEWLKVTSQETWSEITMMGEAGKASTWTMEFKPTANFSKGQAYETNLEFVDANGALRISVPVHYEGISDDKIEFTPTTQWNLTFSADGTEYWISGGTGGATHTPAPNVVSVISKEGFNLVYFENGKWGYVPYGEADWGSYNWFSVEATNKQIKLSVKKNTKSETRKGALMAIPKKVYESLSSLEDLIEPDGSDFKGAYFKYIVADFSQEGVQNVGSGFSITDNNGAQLKLNYLGNDADAVNTFGTTNVYELKLDPDTGYSIFVTPNEYPMYELDYQILLNPWPSVQISPEGKTLAIMSIPNEGGEMNIVFKDEQGQPFAGLKINKWGE